MKTRISLVAVLVFAVGIFGAVGPLLANPDDDRTQTPFAPGLRGNTDRFILKLIKP